MYHSGELTTQHINQQSIENPQAYVDVIINVDKMHIETLKNEIECLRKQLGKSK